MFWMEELQLYAGQFSVSKVYGLGNPPIGG